MKKIFLALLLMLSITSVASAGMFSMVSGMAMKEIQPQASYTVNTAGINPRIYEFDTRAKPIRHCIVLIASSSKMSAPAMQCYKKDN